MQQRQSAQQSSQQANQQTNTNAAAQQPSATPAAGQPAAAATNEPPPSRLEQIMSQRANVRLRQFGYNQFGTNGTAVAAAANAATTTTPQAGAVQDNYVLGPGDEIVITLRGQENSQYSAIVDRDGRITLPRLRPMGAAGRTLAAVRQDIQAAVRQGYVATEAFVSLGMVRQVS